MALQPLMCLQKEQDIISDCSKTCVGEKQPSCNIKHTTSQNYTILDTYIFLDLIPAVLYHTVMEQIASHGFVVMSPFVISYPTIEYNTAWQIELHGWAERHVEDVLINEYGETNAF